MLGEINNQILINYYLLFLLLSSNFIIDVLLTHLKYH